MKFRSVIRRVCALVLLLSMLAGVVPFAFAAQEDESAYDAGIASDAQIAADESEFAAEEADGTESVEETPAARTDATARAAVTPVQNCTTEHSEEEIYAFWINPSSGFYPVTQASIQLLASKGITDLYVLVKGEAGSIETTALKTAIQYAGSMRVHAWVMAGKDEYYLKNVDSNAGASHFRWGLYNRVGGDYYNANAVMAYIDLRNTAYRNYFLTKVVDVLAGINGLDGIHLDTIRYGTINYGWDSTLKTALGKTDYNTVAKALCVSSGYTYTTDSNGYVVYKEGGTTATGSTLQQLLAANNSAAEKLLSYRKETVTGFVKTVKNRLDSKYASKNLILTAAMMPEAGNDEYSVMQYGQSAASLGSYVDYVTLMAYLNEYNTNDPTNFPLDYAWPADLAEAVARDGCNVVAGLQGYPNNSKYPSGDELRAQVQFVHNRRRTINGDPTVKGDILGTALFRAGTSAYAEVKYSPSAQTLSVRIVNSSLSDITKISIPLLTYSNGVKLAYNPSGTISGIGAPTVGTSGGNETLTWTTTIAAGASKSFTIPVTGPTTANYNNVAFCTVRTFIGSAGTTTLTCYPHEYSNGAHTACTYTRSAAKSLSPTCKAAGYNVYVCNTCGDSYCEYVPARGGHDFSAGTGSCSLCGGKDNGELIHFKAGSTETTWDWVVQNTTSTATFDTSKNGSMLGSTQSTNANAPSFLVWQNGVCSFKHTVSAGDVVRVRLRVNVTSNPKNLTSVKPDFRFHSNVTDNFCGFTGNATQSISLTSTAWQTVEIPLVGSQYMAGDILDRILFLPFGSNGSIGANVEIDYIYIGQKKTAPVTVTFVDDTGAVMEVHPIKYGDKVSFFGGEPSKPSTSTIRYLFTGWRDSSGNIVNLTTKTFTANATLTANYAEINTEPLASTKTLSDPTKGDESYRLTLDAYTYGKTLNVSSNEPLNVSIVLDRSGSMSFPANPANDKSFADPVDLNNPDLTALNNYLATLDKNKPEGYYTATNWLSVPYYATSEYGYGYVSFEPLRYNKSTGTWQVWMTKSPAELRAYAESTEDTSDSWDMYSYPFGIATTCLSTYGFNSCNPICGDWVNVTQAYTAYVTRRNACKSELPSYDLTAVPFKISVPRRSMLISALNNFIDQLYASSGSLPAGQYHSISVVSYGYGVYAEGESVTVSGTYTYNNRTGPEVSMTGVLLDSTADVTAVKGVLNSCYSYGTTRTDLGVAKGRAYLQAQEKTNPAGKDVMILVTDGAPTGGTAFDSTIANKVISAANAMKVQEATEIFTLGFMAGLNHTVGYTASYSASGATDAQKANNFLNLVSSNYPNATSMTASGTKGSGTFYRSTANGAELAVYMEDIFAATNTVESATLNGSILLYDIVKREWVPSAKQSNGKYFTYTVKSYDYLGLGKFSTTGKTLATSKYTIEEKAYGSEGDVAIYIRWTDAPNAYLRETATNGTMGYKIVVEFDISVNRDRTYGGNNIPTNGSGSGAYYPDNPDNSTISTIYKVPNVNVKPQYDIIVHDYFVSLYNKDSTNDLVSILASNGSIDPFVGMYTRKLQPDGLENRFLTISHIVDDANGVRRWAETLAAGKPYAKWSEGRDRTLDISASGKATSFDYTKDMTGFKTGYILTPTSNKTDTLGNAPYPVSTVTKSTNYYAPKFAVVDFGTSINVSLGSESSLSPTVRSDCTISADKKTLTYTGSAILEGLTTAKYKVTAINTPKDTSSVNRTVHIIPANVVAYESYGFLTLGTGWQSEGTYKAIAQEHNNATVHGFDSNVRQNGKSYNSSYNHSYVATVDETNVNKTMTFEFTGTGFDVISQTGPDEGVMVVEVYSDAAMSVVEKRFLTMNYLENETLYQVPVVHCDDLTYGKHYVKIRAFYNKIFNPNAATRSTLTEGMIRAVLGLTEDDLLEYSVPNVTATPKRTSTRAASATSYVVHVDGIRIYQTLDATPTDKAAAYAYSIADESDSTFVNMKDVLLDATSWTTGTQESGSDGIAYIAATGTNANASSKAEGIHLNMSGELKCETVNGKNYLLKADGTRLTSKKYGTEIYFTTASNGAYRYFCTDSNGKEIALTSAEVKNEELVFYDAQYDTVGPENEVYLSGHNAIAFHVGDSFDVSNARILISARSLNGKISVLQAYNERTGKFVDVTGDTSDTDARKTNRTELYYDVTAYVTSNNDLYLRNADPKNDDGNRYGGITALCNIKLIGAVKLSAPAATVTRAMAILAQEDTATETPDSGSVDTSALVFSNKSLSLQSYVGFHFLVDESALADFDSWYVTFEREDAENGIVRETVNGTEHDGKYLFEYKVYSYQMADSLTATLYAVKDGVTYTGETYTASVADYVMDKIASASDGMKSVYANLLTYGAAAQTYRGYNTAELANKNLASYASYVTATVPSVENIAASTNHGLNGVTLRANALGIASSVQLQFVTTLSSAYDVSNLEAHIDWNGNTKVIDGKDFVRNAAGTTYTVVFEDLCAFEGRTPVSVTIFDKTTGSAISETWTYSIESYVALRQSSTNTNLVTMLNAMMNYYDAAATVYGG